jgi:hypothetical protein
MSDLTLRARTAPQLVDTAFQLLRRHYALFTTLGAVSLLPGIAASMYSAYGIVQPTPRVGTGFALIAVTALWRVLVDAGIQYAAAEAYLGRPASVEGSLRRVLAHAGAVFLSIVVVWALIFVGLMLFIIPGIFLFARYFAIPATVVVEGRRTTEALARSRLLAMGETGKILGTLGLGWVIYFLIVLAATPVLMGLAGRIAGQAIVGVLLIFIYPVLGILTVLLYFDLRIRKEGFDLEVMVGDLPTVPSSPLVS